LFSNGSMVPGCTPNTEPVSVTPQRRNRERGQPVLQPSQPTAASWRSIARRPTWW
jgi:hypothetical protein